MKKLIFISILVFISNISLTQNIKFDLDIFTGEQESIKQALDSSIFIIKQEYILRDTTFKKDYTLDDKPYFGSTYKLAIATDSLIWTDTKLLTPWLNDTNYIYYYNNYGFIPILTNMYIRPIYQSVFEKIELEKLDIGSKFDSLIFINSMLIYKLPNNINTTLPIKYIEDNAKGWTIMAYMQENIEICDSCPVKLSVNKAEADFNNNGKLSKIKDLDNVIGGFFIIPEIKTGIIKLYAVGYIRKMLNWYVKPFLQIENKTLPKLTPINDNKQIIKKKNK